MNTTHTPGPPPDRSPGDGQTQPVQGHAPVARLPHERDESADSQAVANPQEDARRAAGYRDAAGGMPDTDRGPVLDAVYNETLQPDR